MKLRKILSLLLAATICLTAAVPTVASAQTIPADNATDYDISVSDQDGDGVIRVACVGDSITAGGSDSNYPKYLQEYLNVLGEKDGNIYEVKNHGKGSAAVHHQEEQVGGGAWGTVTDADGDGWAYFYYDDIAYTSSLTYTPDVVIVQMGTNDAFAWVDGRAEYFANDYYEYLVKPYQDKGATVIVSTPPYACNNWHDGEVNGPLHDEVVALANDLGLKIVDTNRLMYGLDEAFGDGLHGNVTGYSRMAMNFYHYIFGGEYIEAGFTAMPNTRVTLVNKADNRSYVCVTGEDGTASLPFLPGDYEFTMSAEGTGYKKVSGEIALAGESDTFALTQEIGGYNVAANGMPFACDSKVYGSNDHANLNDGKRTSGGYQPDHWTVGDWCGIQLDKTYPVNNIVLYWETEQYMSSYQDEGYCVYFKIGTEWVLQDLTDVVREVYSGAIVADTVTLDPAAEIEGVKVEFLEGKSSHGFAPKLYELEILTDDPIYIPGITPEPEPTVRPTMDPTVDYGENVALLGIGIACDSEVLGEHGAANLNDATVNAGGYQPNAWKVGDWCGIQLAAASSVDTVVLYWETETYISMYQDKGYRVYVLIDGEWQWFTHFTVTRYDYDGDVVVDVVDIDPAVAVEGVKVEFLEGTCDHKYAPKMYEMEIYGKTVPGAAASGDVDLSGDVDAADLTVLARAVANIEGLTDETALAAADVDRSGSVDAADLTTLARYVGGVAALPTPEPTPTPSVVPTATPDLTPTLDPSNLAAGKTTGDNGHAGSLTPDRAVDGDESTRWGGRETHGAADSQASDDYWWVDFGNEVTFNTVNILWERGYGIDYTLEIKADGGDPVAEEGWEVFHTVTGNNKAGWRELVLDEAVTGRYMRINISKKLDEWGVSFFEVIVRMQGAVVEPSASPTVEPTATPTVEPTATPEPSDDPEPTLDPTNFAAGKVTGDNGHQGSLTSDRAVDGDEEGESRWAGVETHGAADSHASSDYWWVDFGEEATFNTVKIKWEVCYGRAYTIEVKDASGDPTDPEGWTVVESITENRTPGWVEHNLSEAATGRYMRINITEKDNTWGVSFYEVIVTE